MDKDFIYIIPVTLDDFLKYLKHAWTNTMLCNGNYTNCKYERANLPCLPLCNCKYKNTIGITNGLATSNALINKHSVRNTQLRALMH